VRMIAAQDIKKRGIAAVDALAGEGPVYVVSRNQPRYVILTMERYAEMVEEINEATEARIALALEDYRAGRYTVYESADAYLAEVDKMLDE
jgi:PHD/YefM family antitoxin component YafN of YafNO toxin-antitoxin module